MQYEDKKKPILLNLFIILISLTNIAVISYLYRYLSPAQSLQQSLTYQTNLKKYMNEYMKKEEHFQNYSFYESYDMLVFQDAQINQDYKHSIDSFSTLTQKEFYSLFDIVRKITGKKGFGEISRFGFNYTDWSNNRVVIRDQKGFNTSFIFSALTSLQYRINRNTTAPTNWITLSPQQIIDCCPTCMSTHRPQSVFDYIKQSGIHQQKNYPYENSRFDTLPKKCRSTEKQGNKYYISGYISVKNCAALEKAIKIGPVVVGVDGRKFPDYQYSVFKDCQRKTTHYATMVGVSFDHWKLQNSWGRKWGERGYIRIFAGDTCGICLRGSYPVIKQAK